MTEPMAAADNCEHHYQSRLLGGHPLHVRACYFCRKPDWDDLMEQADELYRWGWTEGRAGKAPREALSAYDKPREAPDGELAGRNGARSPQAASSDALRERLVDSLEHYPVACWTPVNLAGRVMGVIGGELDRWEKVARDAEHGRQMAVECFTVYRNDAKQLHATLAEVLDAFEAYWARASYCGPSETAVQPEHFRAWRDMLRPEALDARNAEAAIARVRKAIASFDGRGVIAPGHVNFDIPTAGEVLDKVREALDPAAIQATERQEQP